MRRRYHRVAAARHVAADRIHRDVLMAEYDAGQRFDLEIAQRLLLFLRKTTHLCLGELDVVEIALLHRPDGALDLGRRQLERGRRPIIELLRQLAHGNVLARVDIGEDLLDRLTHLGVGRLDRACVHSALEVAGHGIPPVLSLSSSAKADDPVFTETQSYSRRRDYWVPRLRGA